jgi:hypothetical protein
MVQYICNICNKEFVRKKDLEYHQIHKKKPCVKTPETLFNTPEKLQKNTENEEKTNKIDENIEIREVGIHFYIKYTGPLGGQSGTKKINERIPQYKGRWSNSMKDQIKYLPKFEQVEREIQRHLKRIVL